MLPEVAGREALVALEEAAEGGLLREAEVVGYLLDALLALGAQQPFCLHHHVAVDPLRGGEAGGALDDGGEILGCQGEQVGVELHLAALAVVVDDGLVETLEQLVVQQQRLGQVCCVTAYVLSAEGGEDAELLGYQFVALRHVALSQQAYHAQGGVHGVKLPGREREDRHQRAIEILGQHTHLPQAVEIVAGDEEREHGVVGADVVVRQHVVGRYPADVAGMEVGVAVVVLPQVAPLQAQADVEKLRVILHAHHGSPVGLDHGNAALKPSLHHLVVYRFFSFLCRHSAIVWHAGVSPAEDQRAAGETPAYRDNRCKITKIA